MNENTTNATVAIAKGMDCFKYEMECGDFIKKIRREITGFLDKKLAHHPFHLSGRGSDMGAHSHILAGRPETSRDTVVDTSYKHPMQQEYHLLRKLRSE